MVTSPSPLLRPSRASVAATSKPSPSSSTTTATRCGWKSSATSTLRRVAVGERVGQRLLDDPEQRHLDAGRGAGAASRAPPPWRCALVARSPTSRRSDGTRPASRSSSGWRREHHPLQLAQRGVGGAPAARRPGGGGGRVVADGVTDQLGVQRGVGEQLHGALEDVLGGAVVVDVDEVEELAHRLVGGGARAVDRAPSRVATAASDFRSLPRVARCSRERVDALAQAEPGARRCGPARCAVRGPPRGAGGTGRPSRG